MSEESMLYTRHWYGYDVHSAVRRWAERTGVVLIERHTGPYEAITFCFVDAADEVRYGPTLSVVIAAAVDGSMGR